MFMAVRVHDPVYLVVFALGVGMGLSVGFASGSVGWGAIGGAIVGAIGVVVYYFIKKKRQPKVPKGAKQKFRMKHSK
jgi:membrane associated rhomboid family serine protease